jgi:hypothetical protein
LKRLLQEFVRTVEILGQSLPTMMFVDNCCLIRAFLQQYIPSLNDELSASPALQYRKKFIYCDNMATANVVAAAIQTCLEKTIAKDGSAVIGLDAEWDYVIGTGGGKQGNVAMLQIALLDGMLKGICMGMWLILGIVPIE